MAAPGPPPPAPPFVGQAPLGPFNNGAQQQWGPPAEAPPDPDIVPTVVAPRMFNLI